MQLEPYRLINVGAPLSSLLKGLIVKPLYDDLINDLWTAGFRAVEFPYDWRLDIWTNAQKLEEKVSEWRRKTENQLTSSRIAKVD